MKIPSPFAARHWRRGLAVCIAFTLLLGACGSSADDEAVTTADQPTTDSTTTADATSTDDTADPADTADTADAEGAADDAEDAADTADDSDEDTGATEDVSDASSASADGVDLGLFFDGALVGEATIEDCTLSGGAEATCYNITVAGYPASHETGPFCPSTITDDVGGLWWDGEAIYDLTGEFIVDLPEIYNDDNWQMYDADGNVLFTETAEEFELAARPDVDPSLQNHCVEGRLEWLENGEPITTTVLIPTEPVAADAAAAPQGNQGITLDGVVIANAAPVDAILGAYTIAAFDDCGAHFNPNDGYHMHGAVGCSEVGDDSAGDPAMFGYAMDGYAIHSPFDDDAALEAAGLDACNGHITEADGYHYHANSAEENQVVECLIGQTVAGSTGGAGGRPDGPPPGADEG